MKDKSPFSRRKFVKTTSVAAIGAPLILKSSLIRGKGITAASDKINLGIIGCGAMGKANLNAAASHPDVEITAACDVWKERLDPVVEEYKKTCTAYTDYRDLLQQKGIDGVIKEDRLGLDVIYVQAKRWEGTVGRPEIQKFAGALQGKRANKGVFITTSNFSKEAFGFANSIDSKIILIDGIKLAQLMIEFNVGASTTGQYLIKQIDSDYFDE